MKTLIFILFSTLSVYVVLSDDLSEDILSFMRDYKPPPKCPRHQIYKYCLPNCTTCDERGTCEVDCTEKGCDCISHFFRLEPGGPCEPAGMCPKPQCGENETFRECGPMCEKCSDYRCRVIHCDHKCYCIENHLRNSEGVCVPTSECPKKDCECNDVWAEEGPIDEYCMHTENYVFDDNATQQEGKCYCEENMKRNVMGICINSTYCPNLSCFGREKYYDCIPKCNTTCRRYGDPDCEEDAHCYPGCFCLPGYVMNDHRACVLLEDCPKDTESVATSTEKLTEKKEKSDQSSHSEAKSVSISSESSTDKPKEKSEQSSHEDAESVATSSEASTEKPKEKKDQSSNSEVKSSATSSESSKEESSQASQSEATSASSSSGESSGEDITSSEVNHKAEGKDEPGETESLTTSAGDDQPSSVYDDKKLSKESSSDDKAYDEDESYSDEEDETTAGSNSTVKSIKIAKSDASTLKKEKPQASKRPSKHKIHKDHHDDFENEK